MLMHSKSSDNLSRPVQTNSLFQMMYKLLIILVNKTIKSLQASISEIYPTFWISKTI